MLKEAMQFGKIFKQANEMQKKMTEVQAGLANKTVIGNAGAGAVEVEVSGHYRCIKVVISDEAAREDKEMLQSLLAAAFNDATSKVAELTQKELSNVTGGLDLPAGFKLPF